MKCSALQGCRHVSSCHDPNSNSNPDLLVSTLGVVPGGVHHSKQGYPSLTLTLTMSLVLTLTLTLSLTLSLTLTLTRTLVGPSLNSNLNLI